LFRYHQISRGEAAIGAAICAASSLELYFGELFMPARTSRAIGAGLFVVGASIAARGVGLADQYGVWSVKRMRALYKRKGRAS
jgi:hypothetical protein